MSRQTNPLSWQDIAASYDPRGLPFMQFFVEAGMTKPKEQGPARIFCQKLFGKKG